MSPIACACGSNKKSSTQNWLHKKPNGSTQTYSSEMDARLDLVLRAHQDPWLGFLAYCRAYLAMAQEAEIRRIVLQDARSVLTGTDQGQQHQQCIAFIASYLQTLMAQGVIVQASAPALARLL